MTETLRHRINECLLDLGADPGLVTTRGLPIFEDAQDLVVVSIDDNRREHQLTPQAAKHWLQLEAAALDSGISLFIVSAYRGFARQAEICRSALERGRTLESVFSSISPPGCSEHHTGCAIDFGTPGCEDLSEAFEHTAAFEWLACNANTFGFRLSFPRDNTWGYCYEPWHWCLSSKLRFNQL